jgi:hypothetical protein
MAFIIVLWAFTEYLREEEGGEPARNADRSSTKGAQGCGRPFKIPDIEIA